MWIDAIQKIKLSDLPLYPCQVSSPIQLDERINSASTLELQSIEKIQQVKDKLYYLNNKKGI